MWPAAEAVHGSAYLARRVRRGKRLSGRFGAGVLIGCVGVMNGDYRSARLRLRERGKITLTFITHTPAQGKRNTLSLALNSLV